MQHIFFFPAQPAKIWIWLISMLLLLFHHTFLPFSMWKTNYLSWGKVGSRVTSSSLHGSGSTSTLGWSGSGSIGILWYQSMSALLHFGISITSWRNGVECCQLSLDISGELCVSFCCVSSPSSLQVSGRTFHRSTQNSYSSCDLLDRGILDSSTSQHVEDHSSSVSYHKNPHHGCFGRLGAVGTAVAEFNPLAAQRCLLCRQGFSSSVCQAVAGAT